MAAALRRVRGVTSATVDRRTHEAVVERRVGTAPGTSLTSAVRRVGYGATVIPTYDVWIGINGLDCNGCPEQVRTALTRMRGVRGVQVNDGRAHVYYDRRRVDTPRLVEAIRRAGFTARALS